MAHEGGAIPKPLPKTGALIEGISDLLSQHSVPQDPANCHNACETLGIGQGVLLNLDAKQGQMALSRSI